MNICSIPKFVVNLERRPDRLESIKKEMDYIGWDYELFKAVDLNHHGGCTLSHVEIIKIAKERGYKSVLVIEDDCTFLPYSKDLINKTRFICSNDAVPKTLIHSIEQTRCINLKMNLSEF